MMAGIKKHSDFAIWFLLLAICLAGCENYIAQVEPKIDYTGQKGSVTDIDGNIYQTIGIGSQIWMAENLSVSRLNDGTLIPEIKSDSIWDRNRELAYCSYNNSDSCKKLFGLLYNYYTVNTGLLCPAGWHLPSSDEWTTLMLFAGGRKKAGGKLKSMRSTLWEGPNYGFEENYEFNALPGGGCQSFGLSPARFMEAGVMGYWWTTDSLDYFKAMALSMKNSNTTLTNSYFPKRNGYSVRCVKN